MAVSEALQQAVLRRFLLDHDGHHGPLHWERVRENGLFLASRLPGVDVAVVEAFAWLHDSCRRNEGGDPAHGLRSAEFAIELVAAGHLAMDQRQVDLLALACGQHSYGPTEGDVTVQVCWDADRLDLGRVGTMPVARYLCTEPARHPQTIEWAYSRSRGGSATTPEL